MVRAAATAAAAATALALAAGLVYVLWPDVFRQGDPLAECRGMAVVGGPGSLGGDFTLVSETGGTVTRDAVIDGLALVYFGYTFCPDVCPVDTVRNADAVDLLAARGLAVKPVFVTVDPERDDPAALRDFTDLVHPAMVGLTGTPEVIRATVKAFGAYGAKQGTGEDYLVSHSTYTYLMAPGQGVLDVIRRDRSAEEVAETVACFAGKLGLGR